MQKVKKSIIAFIRHGETDWNTKGLMQGRDDVPLNENGKNQAKNAAECLKNALNGTDFKFDKIIYQEQAIQQSVLAKPLT